MIEWSTVEQWVRDWLDVINYIFNNAIAILDVSPFNSSIRVIDTAMTAVEGVALVPDQQHLKTGIREKNIK